jgi:hypothetical protein
LLGKNATLDRVAFFCPSCILSLLMAILTEPAGRAAWVWKGQHQDIA